MMREAIERNGYKDVKECARSIKVPYDLFNKVVGGHIPKDAQLIEYAKKLNIDHRELILAAYREKAPEEMKRYFNSVQLLDNHNKGVQELSELIDACNAEQLAELLNIARLIRSTPKEYCQKAATLLALYHQLPPEVMQHFDSVVLLTLRSDDLPGLKEFQNAAKKSIAPRSGRRRRLRS
ncbi:MAG: hypothetical protein HY342_12070 [Candidatus Lambdaproteobacteria bacterium]|nr:hypothetical protein [Candidatus Lambdaproteobacteria bacterium]